MEFEHAGTKIKLHENGDFSATVLGKLVYKQSLAAMKKHLTEIAKAKFEPLDGLREKGWQDKGAAELIPVRALGIKKIGRSGRYQSEKWGFIIEGRHDEPEKILFNTPENIAAINEAKNYRIETDRIRNERRDKQSELDEAVKYHVAIEYSAKRSD